MRWRYAAKSEKIVAVLGRVLLLAAGAAATHVVVTRRRRLARAGPRAAAVTVPARRRPAVCARPAPWPAVRRRIARAADRGRRAARTVVWLATLPVHLLALARLRRALLMEQSSSQCSLAAAFAYIAAAIAMLGSASALAALFFNIPALTAAIGLVLWVSWVMIPQIRAELEAYVRCRGPSERCRLDLNVNTLGQAAMLTAVGAWFAALVLQLLALTHFGTIFLIWLGILELATSEVLKWGGVASNIAAAAVLAALTTMVLAYKACRDAEESPVPPISEPAPIG